MNLVQRFSDQVEAAPDRVAIVQRIKGQDESVTYRELDRLSGRAAAFLQELGLAHGDRALVFERMSINLYILLIALWKLGVVATFVDPQGGRRLLQHACRATKPKAFIALPKAHLYRLVSSEIRRMPIKVSLGPRLLPSHSWKRLRGRDSYSGIVDVSPSHPALYTFTSGSTGTPKASIRTHGLLLAQHDALADSIDLQAGEVDLATLPIFTLANLASGLTTVIPNANLQRPGAIEPGPVMDQLQQRRPTRCVASPSFLLRLAEEAERRDADLPFTKVYTGGAPVFPRYLKTLRRVCPHARISAVYGSTEAEPIAHVSLSEYGGAEMTLTQSGHGLLAGEPSPFTELRIIQDRVGESLLESTEDSLASMQQPAGEPGEIIVSGPHVLKGYLDGVGDGENKIRTDRTVWHRTGDAGYIDAKGRLWLLGRCAAKVRVGPRTVYPFAIEAAVSQDPRIAWSAFLEYKGRPTLAVELVSRKAKPRPIVSEYPCLNDIDVSLIFIDRMPLDKRHQAKIDYPALRKRLGGSRHQRLQNLPG